MPASKTLVVAPAWVGDMVMAHTLVPGLRGRGEEVHFLAPPSTLPVATRMPGVSGVHRLDVRHGELGLKTRYLAGRALARLRFRRAVILPNTFKSALAPLWAGIPVRSGFRGERRYGIVNDLRGLAEEGMPRLVDRYAALADVAPAAPRLEPDPIARKKLIATHGLDTRRPVVALCPGAEYGPAKRWPAAHFAALAGRLVRAGLTVWVFGTQAERGIAAQVVEAAPTAVDLTGRTKLADAVDLMSVAAAAVVNDSGLMHVAAALDVPLAALFGSSSSAFTPPMSARAAILERQLDCRPCFKRACPLDHLDCLTGIGVDDVFNAVMASPTLARSPLRVPVAAK